MILSCYKKKDRRKKQHYRKHWLCELNRGFQSEAKNSRDLSILYIALETAAILIFLYMFRYMESIAYCTEQGYFCLGNVNLTRFCKLTPT